MKAPIFVSFKRQNQNMKKLYTILFFLAAPLYTLAQDADSVVIEKSGSWGVNFANVGLSNWAAGGENSISLGTVLNTKWVRKQGNSQWTNQMDFALGGAKVGEQEFRKTDDNLILLSKFTKGLNDKIKLSATGIFRTQMLEGLEFRPDPINTGAELSNKISDFMAPGYFSINLGFDYQPSDFISISFAPAAGKFTFVSDDQLSAVGAFGVDPGKKTRAEFGANFLATLNIPIMENISFNSSLNFFSSYEEFGTIDTNWESLLVMKVNKWFNATFGTQLIYDEDILIAMEDGSVGTAVQFKHVLNFGVNFSLFKAGS